MQDILRCVGLNKSYPGEEFPVIKNAEMTVQEGEFILIYGPSGSGKSTLLNLFLGIDHPDSGELYFRGERYDNKNDRAITYLRRFSMGVVLQSFELIPSLSCFSNIEFPLILQGVPKDERVKHVKEVGSGLEIRNLLSRKPSRISGGQQQRVALARALVADYPVILGDEITGNLDSKMTERVFLYLKQRRTERKQTFILVSHDPALKPFATTIYRLNDGSLEREK